MNNKKMLLITIILITGIALIILGMKLNSNSNPKNESGQTEYGQNENSQNQNNQNENNQTENGQNESNQSEPENREAEHIPNANDVTSSNSYKYDNLGDLKVSNVKAYKGAVIEILFDVTNNLEKTISNKKLLVSCYLNNSVIETVELEIASLEANETMSFGFTTDTEELMNKNIEYRFSLSN